ncbi:MAG: ParB/Srx family N-terminal domain-containing protein [Candidatus Acidiferrales bacterium]
MAEEQHTNARPQTRRQIANVAASIREFDWTNPVLVGAGNDVIAGHARSPQPAARKPGMTGVPVIVLRHLLPEQRRALLIADHQLATTRSGWGRRSATGTACAICLGRPLFSGQEGQLATSGPYTVPDRTAWKYELALYRQL